MAKIHIALVGAQIYPIYLGIKNDNPDGIILVHSSETRSAAERLKSEFPNIAAQLYELDPVSMVDIESQVRRLEQNLSLDDSYTVNITGGTKMWAFVFTVVLQPYDNVHFIYIDQNNVTYDMTDGTSQKTEPAMNIDTLFRLYGANCEKYTSLDFYSQEDFDMIKEIRDIRKFDFRNFNALTMIEEDVRNRIQAKNPNNHGEIRFPKGLNATLEWSRSDNTICIESTTRSYTRTKSWTLNSPNIFSILFNHAWFELEVARILSGWRYAKEIILNVKFAYTNKSAKNEIDIIVNTGDKLLFVECKTQINDVTDIDKFRSAVRNYGGMGSKALFVCDSKMRQNVYEKCNDNSITSFSFEDCKARKQDIKKQLIQTIESNLFNINTR